MPNLEIASSSTTTLVSIMWMPSTAAFSPEPSPFPSTLLALTKQLDRLHSIIKNCRPALALTSGSVFNNLMKDDIASDPILNTVHWLIDAKDQGETHSHSHSHSSQICETALLQYTSGSTGTPKGVILTHANLLANMEAIQNVFQLREDDLNISWLPPYHDMGLIGSILGTFYGGTPSLLMSPFTFIQRPVRWPMAISRHKATVSGGPNFSYDLITQRVSDSQREEIDLESWRIAYCGAEAIRPSVLQSFAKVFKPCGFHAKALFPCYGLAEATLLVSGKEGGVAQPFHCLTVEANGLESRGQVIPSRQEAREGGLRTLASCGKSPPHHHIEIVDPKTRRRKAFGHVGEIWVSGPSIAQGYWNAKGEETERTFQAHLKDEDENFDDGDTGGRAYLRTGDFGFTFEGQLYITGRMKDLIILKGRNVYPQDIEQTVESAHELLKSNGCAAFSVEHNDEEKLVIIQEIKRGKDREGNHLNFDEVFHSIDKRVFEYHGLSPHAIFLVKPNSIPLTSSGKVQRYLTKQHFLANRLNEFKRKETP